MSSGSEEETTTGGYPRKTSLGCHHSLCGASGGGMGRAQTGREDGSELMWVRKW